MKKVTLWSLIITAGLFVINFLSAHIFGFIFTLYDRSGFGIYYSPEYSSPTGVPRPESIEFDFPSLIHGFICVFLIGCIIYMIIKLPKKISIISLIATAVLFAANLISTLVFGFNFGIEVVGEGIFGFGVFTDHYVWNDDHTAKIPVMNRFHFVSLLVTFILIFLIAALIYKLIKGPRKVIIISLSITAGMFLTNLICGIFFDFLPFGIMLFGGEMFQMVGCGVNIVHFVPLSTIDNPAKGSTSINVDPISLILTFAIVFLITSLIASLIRCLAKRRAERKAAKALAATSAEEAAEEVTDEVTIETAGETSEGINEDNNQD